MTSPTSSREKEAEFPAAGLAACAAGLAARGSLEASSPRAEGAQAIGALLPPGTRVYVPHFPKQELAASLPALEALRAAGLQPVPHIAARRVSSRAEVESFLRKAAVGRVLVIGGDEPTPLGPYRQAADLMREGGLVATGVREVGISGYPEGHPLIDRDELERAFDEKLSLASKQGLAVHVVTQFSFSGERIAEYCADLARRAPGIPVRVGLAGPTEPVALLRFARRCGVGASMRALRAQGLGAIKLMTHVNPDEELGAVARYCLGQRECNVAGVHLFSFGGAERSAAWLRETAARGA